MHSYTSLAHQVLNMGERRPNRTGIDTIGIFGAFFVHDMADGFPLLTTKKMAFASGIGELCAFLKGATSAEEFREFGCNFWSANANENESWLANPFRKGEDDLGPVYGAQWRHWNDHRVFIESVGDDDDFMEHLKNKGYEIYHTQGIDEDLVRHFMYRKIDQIQQLVDRIKKDPYSRYHIVTAWNPSVVDQVALPACHMGFQCYVRGEFLDLQWNQRSADLFLGVPVNIMSYAALLCVLAQLTGKKPGRLSASFGDLHIYENHLDQIKEQITREPMALPTLSLAPIMDINDVTPDKFQLIGYESHPALKGAMAV